MQPYGNRGGFPSLAARARRGGGRRHQPGGVGAVQHIHATHALESGAADREIGSRLEGMRRIDVVWAQEIARDGEIGLKLKNGAEQSNRAFVSVMPSLREEALKFPPSSQLLFLCPREPGLALPQPKVNKSVENI